MRIRIAIAAWLLSAAAVAQSAPAQPKVHSDLLVSTGWLAEHLNDPKLVIVEAGAKPEDHYAKEHIPGARFIGYREFIDSFDGEMGPGSGAIELPSTEKLRAVLERLGVSNDSRLVIYTEKSLTNATRLFYTLDYMGLGERTALLDGGFAQWAAEKRTLTAEVPQVAPGKLTLPLNEHARATTEEVKAASEAKYGKTLLLDSRPVKWQQDHIPGAAALEFTSTVSDPQKDARFKPVAELQKLFGGAGATAEKKVIPYCAVGMVASQNYFVARYLGYDTALYDGSISEWHKAKLPTVPGPAGH